MRGRKLLAAGAAPITPDDLDMHFRGEKGIRTASPAAIVWIPDSIPLRRMAPETRHCCGAFPLPKSDSGSEPEIQILSCA
jgi:hypothetical protein